jgi:hypothetical protein
MVRTGRGKRPQNSWAAGSAKPVAPEARLPGTTVAGVRYSRQLADQRNDVLASRRPSGSTVTSTVIAR